MIWAALLGCTSPTLPADVARDAKAAAAEVDCGVLETEVRALADANAAYSGVAKSEPARAWLLDHLTMDGFTVDEEVETANGLTTRNLIVELPGSGRGTVLVSAHYDVFYTGADDNCTGVGVALELLRVLADRPLKRTVRVVLFDQEEAGLYGSRRYYDAHSNDDIDAVINLDAVGFADRRAGSQDAPPGMDAPDRGDFILAAANGPGEHLAVWMAQLAGDIPGSAKMLGMVGAGANDWGITGDFHRSDHSPAWRQGIPALFLSDTANFRNPNYHTPSDVADTIDWDFLCGVGRMTVALTVAAGSTP